MNRWTDLLASFGLAMLLHGLLVLGAVWFWTLRPPELRPVFQGGDVSLAVTFVAAPPTPKRYGGQVLADRGERTAPPSPERFGGRATTDDPDLSESRDRKSETTEIMTDTETEMSEDGSLTADGSLPADLSTVASEAKVEAPGAKAGRQFEEDTGRRTPDASLKKTPDTTAALPSATLRQGVSGAVRMQSEIRPYYPLGARLRGEEGAVTVRVWVNGSGRALRCEVARSSGYPVLDEAAVDAARRARYVSTQPGAWRTEAETTLTFRFRLTE